MGDLRAAPVVGPSGRGSAPPSRPNDLNSTTKITHSIFFYPSVSTFTSAASSWPFSVHCGIPILLVHYHEESDIKNAPHVCERRFSAVRKGLEPSTSGVTGRHSNQLNYRTLRISALTVSGCFPNADAKIGIFPLPANFFT